MNPQRNPNKGNPNIEYDEEQYDGRDEIDGGRSMRKSSKKTVKKSAKKTVKKECPTKTSRTYKGKDGVVRRLYKRAGDFFVRVKSKITGKFGYRKVKA